MKLFLNYGNDVAVLPHTVLAFIDKATKKDIKILFEIASCGMLSAFENMGLLASKLGITEKELQSAVKFWCDAGVLCVSEKADVPEKALPESDEKITRAHDEKRLLRLDEFPRYTTEELTGILEKRAEYKKLINECQQLFGKVFNTSEINILIALTDYLGLDSEAVMLLFAYCGKLEHKSVRTVEKLAQRFTDEGLTTAEAFEERLKVLDETEKAEKQIRKIFGIGTRPFTKKEKDLINKWVFEYHFDTDMIEKAYERTVDSTQKTSLPYAGAILDRWYSENILTVKNIEKDAEEHKKGKSTDGGSFNTDEFLEIALKRSFPEVK